MSLTQSQSPGSTNGVARYSRTSWRAEEWENAAPRLLDRNAVSAQPWLSKPCCSGSPPLTLSYERDRGEPKPAVGKA